MPDETDQLLCVAEYVEDQLEAMGAMRGRDYTILDLAKLAMEQNRVNAISQLADQIESLRFEMLGGE